MVRAAVEAAVNAAVKTVALVAVKAVVNMAVVGVLGETPTQMEIERTGTKDPILTQITDDYSGMQQWHQVMVYRHLVV